MAFPVTLNGRTYTLTDFEGTNYVDGLPDAFEDFVTHAGDIYNSTSTTSNSIGTGSKTFTVEANKPYQAGTPLRIADAAAPSTNFLDTVVTSYSGTTLVVNSIGFGGSGTKTSWTVNIGGAKTVDGTLGLSQGGTGATDAAGARTNIDVYSKADADSRFLNVSGEASNVTMNGDVTIGNASSDSLTINAAMSALGNIKLDGNYPTGTDNVALGNTALDSITSGAAGNVAIGDSALTAATTGDNAVAIGRDAMAGIYTGTDAVAIGRSALSSLTSGINNVAVGTNTLALNVDSGYNTALGMEALYSTTGASTNYNVAVGYQAGYTNTSGNIVAVGRRALYNHTTGIENTAMGRESAHELTNGSHNTAYGYRSLYSASTSQYNTAIGAQALFSQVDGNVSNKSTAVGFQAGYSATRNVDAFGSQAAYSNTTGASNVAVGRESLYTNQTGNSNTALGYQTLYTTNQSENTAIGYQSMKMNVASDNTAVGAFTMLNNSSGTGNTALGKVALQDNTSGSFNVAVGKNALENNSTASNNTAVGYQAGYATSTGDSNTFVGEGAGYSTVGNRNTFVGREAGRASNLASTQQNTFVGTFSGRYVTSGAKNTILGAYDGNQDGLDIRTSSNNIVLSDGDGNPRLYIKSDGDVLIGTTSNLNMGANNIQGVDIGSAGTILASATGESALHVGRQSSFGSVVTFACMGTADVGSIDVTTNATSYTTSSDYRLKENVVELTGATTRLKQLNPSRFNFIADADTTVDGFLAHEVQAVVPEAITGTKDAVDADGNPVYQGIDQGKLVPLLVATIKELEARITALETP